MMGSSCRYNKTEAETAIIVGSSLWSCSCLFLFVVVGANYYLVKIIFAAIFILITVRVMAIASPAEMVRCIKIWIKCKRELKTIDRMKDAHD